MQLPLLLPVANLLTVLSNDVGTLRPPAALDAALSLLGDRGVYVQIPGDLDRSAYVATAIARQCGPEAVRSVAAALARERGRGVIGALRPYLRDRALVIERPHTRPERAQETLAELLGEARPWELLRGPWEAWLVSTDAHASVASIVEPRRDVPWQADALWARVDRDPTRYSLAVGCALCLDRVPEDDVLRDRNRLARALWEGLPEDLQELLDLLRVHGRPIEKGHLLALNLVDPTLVDEAFEGCLLDLRRGQVVLPEALREVIAAGTSPSTATQHRRWAEAFERAGQEPSSAVDRPTALLEAHRHFAAVPDSTKARSLATFGSGVLLSMAHDQARGGDHAGAAETYERAQEMLAHVESVDRHLRAYVTHYLHYNRYKARPPRETLAETIAGYREATAAWPQNVLFASRLVRSLFLSEREEDALSLLRRSWGGTVDREASSSFLLNRSIRRLTTRGQFVAALAVASAAPDGMLPAPAVWERLERHLREGWTTRRLWSPGAVGFDLPGDVRCRLDRSPQDVWVAVCGTATRREAEPLSAWSSAVLAVRFSSLAERWVRETSHLSSRSAKFAHPAYAEILALGRDVAPEILRWMRGGGRGHWDAALARLTGEQPALPGEPVTLSQLSAAWIEWGRERGLLVDDDGPDVA